MTTEKEAYPKISEAMERVGASFPDFLAKNFTRIVQRIEQFWGAQEAIDYFNSLLLDNREDRQGFPHEALSEIAQLKQVHDFFFPSLDINPFDPFSETGRFAPRAARAPGRFAVDTIEFTGSSELAAEPVPPSATAVMSQEAGFSAHEQEVEAKRSLDFGSWPRVRTQHELFELAELRHGGNALYLQQGKPIGEILIHYGYIDEQTLRVVRRMQGRDDHQNQPIGHLLLDIGVFRQDDLICALCIQSGIIMVDLLATTIPSEVIKLVPGNKAREHQVMPVGLFHDTLYLAVADPFAFNDKSYFTMLTGLNVETVYSPRHEIVNRLNMQGFGKSSHDAKEEFHNLAQKTFDLMPTKVVVETAAPELDISENNATIINLVNQMILNAIHEGASDIHIELFQDSKETEIRFRRDGIMENFSSFPRSYHSAVVSRIKIMAGLDISERRRPQDGKISFALSDSSHIDLRVSTIPALRGAEFVTIRILALGDPLPLADLGMAAHDLETFLEAAHHSYGLILVCGPTGSGKTTTLHSVMRELNTSDRKIWTVEDPVEIVQPHLCQVQVQSKIGVTFASVLRSLLRADPDIIMIGEMRDQETAKIALEASMTGHLVLSTLHTNSASETVARLLDLGIDPYNLSDALLSILAQRLARKLCQECARREEASAGDLDELANEYYQSAYGKLPPHAARDAIIKQWRTAYGETDGKLYLRHPVGCAACSGGYKGRIGLYEMLRATPALRQLIRHQSSAADYHSIGIDEGMRTLRQDGIEKVLRGITDISQVHSVCA